MAEVVNRVVLAGALALAFVACGNSERSENAAGGDAPGGAQQSASGGESAGGEGNQAGDGPSVIGGQAGAAGADTCGFEAHDLAAKAPSSCEFVLPEPDDGTLDLDHVNVHLYQDSTLSDELLLYVPDCSEDGGGWFYASEAPATIMLCPAACELYRTTPGISVGVNYGCAPAVL